MSRLLAGLLEQSVERVSCGERMGAVLLSSCVLLPVKDGSLPEGPLREEGYWHSATFDGS